MLKCKYCGSENVRVGVKLLVYIPGEMFHHLSKTKLRDKRCELWGADWMDSSIVCSDCGGIVDLSDRHKEENDDNV